MSIVIQQTGILADTTTPITPSQPIRCARHQIDAMGPAAGSLAVRADHGAGLRQVATIDFAETDRVPFVYEGEVDAFELVPTDLDAPYDICYRAEERR